MAGNCAPLVDAFEQIDAPFDAFVPGQICHGMFFRTCVDTEPADRVFTTGTVTINTNDTTNCTLVQPQAQLPMVCVIAGRDIMIPQGTTVRVHGQLPVAFYATRTLLIAGTVDVSSNVLGNKGAGGNTGTCSVAAPGNPGASASGGAGGGAGGAFIGEGGGGGAGAGGFLGGMTTPEVPGPGLKQVRGGCPGARGGNVDTATGGTGGQGGGAVHFMAIGNIQLTDSAVINASGAGGSQSDPRTGGGGGGSGGFIGFSSPSFTVSAVARVYAIGGGGSAGGGISVKGDAGAEAIGPADTTMRLGFEGGGAGARGTAGAGEGGTGGTMNGGGGGGGGGGGLIGFEGGSFTGGAVQPAPRPL